ncbi:ATPase AAA [Paenibacillus swuensis]|uniref:ATPase AAA n=1 Tax=Paenibacillus swuensis TaxID=1178515 RepID=A0A172TLN1_9BACL|nr:stage V sporulation protein K [Paenibacillus swuensis]ANE47876.1 ATPase AAA [Paenibacillus swuensis]
MNGRVVTSAAKPRPSRQINIVLRNTADAQSPVMSANTAESEALVTGKSTAQDSQFTPIQKQLDQMVGMENVKELVYEIYALLQITQMRTEAGLQSGSQVYHMIFRGNPGTGKTTVARMVARLFQSMGVLSKGHLIEVERADLVGEYIGHTAQRTRDLVKKALGGILFIDEAYSLARGGEKDFGKEAIDTLVKAMEDHKNQFILILAGYSGEMNDFLMLNPGLPSRFPIQIDFPDYTVDQLLQICDMMLLERDYQISPTSLFKLRQHLLQEKQLTLHSFSNARYVRNVIEKAIRYQAVRLLDSGASPTKQELMQLKPEDLRFDKI